MGALFFKSPRLSPPARAFPAHTRRSMDSPASPAREDASSDSAGSQEDAMQEVEDFPDTLVVGKTEHRVVRPPKALFKKPVHAKDIKEKTRLTLEHVAFVTPVLSNGEAPQATFAVAVVTPASSKQSYMGVSALKELRLRTEDDAELVALYMACVATHDATKKPRTKRPAAEKDEEALDERARAFCADLLRNHVHGKNLDTVTAAITDIASGTISAAHLELCNEVLDAHMGPESTPPYVMRALKKMRSIYG